MNAPARPVLLRLAGVTKRFWLGKTEVIALRDVDLQVRAGEMLAVWGPSGSGKSTLMNLAGLVDAPSEGQVFFEGEAVQYQNERLLAERRNRRIGFVFQTFNLVPVLSVLENVQLPLQIRGVRRAEAQRRAGELVEQVGLLHLAHVRPDLLSGGQRQRVAIARALVGEPALVIADEPTANLDSENSAAVLDLMDQLNRDSGVAFMFSTHDPRLLDRVSRQVKLVDGRIDGPAPAWKDVA